MATIRFRSAMMWGAAAAAGAAVGTLVARSVQRVYATQDEHTRPLPGDELIPDALGSLTNAITIHATPREVWPWLVQMGAGRAGWYSYDALDNGRRASADRIIPELQHLEAGMVFPALPGATDGFTLAAFDPERSLVLDWKAPAGVQTVTWTFVLERLGERQTRLIVRARAAQNYQFHGLPAPVANGAIGVVHFIMQRKQLLGIAKRAEASAAKDAA